GKDGEEYISKVEGRLGYPMIVKLCVGSLGKGVYLAKKREDLEEIIAELGNKPHIYQKYYGERGTDIRVIVVGGKAVAAMKRVNENDFRANVELGGKGYKHALSEEERKVAEAAATAVRADYCGVDILTENGKIKVCEINSNAFFKEVSRVSCENIAKIYAKFIFERVKASK
ncbi:MAG: ATP-grasp domain-containing protein, partial [Clostridia bacterium]|nr:ATP-grasp domain-containing protein [Clostridia bacterium]